MLLSFSIFAQNPSKAPIPNWVEKHTYSLDIKNEEDLSGYYYLLSDKQINTIVDTYYIRNVAKILNSEGITQLSDLTFEFDPEYEKLIFHDISVIRNGDRINKLNLNEIQTVQRESNLERKLYDGRLTSIINLLDIREGDILDYSYSIIGENPVYEGKFGALLNFKYAVPFGQMQYRFITLKNDDFKFDYKDEAPQPEVRTIGNTKEYIWSLEDVQAKFYDSNTPSWYDDYPRVYISSHGTWEDIANQYRKLYELSSSDKNRLKKLANQNIKGKGEEITLSKKKQIEQLINFVQDDIRYFGFEVGLNSHKPESPLKVLNQRYGDCKGKSFLLSELLKDIGVESYPMLVNTSTGETIGQRIPSPNLFNHCVVNYVYEGEEYYVDPTISNQGGDLSTRYFPNYKKGLILKPGVRALSDLPYKNQSGIDIQEIYDLDKINGAANFRIITTYKGTNADGIRADFQQRSTSSIQKDYVQFYSALFPTIKVDEKISTKDDRENKNHFIVEESYKIDSIWQKSTENEKLLYVEFYPLALENYISPSKSPERTAPYYVSYPVDITYDISVNLPEEWNFDKYNNRIDSEYFTYQNDVDYYLRKLLISHKYSSKVDYIPAEAVNTYVEQHDKIRNDLSYYISYDTGIAQTIDSSGLSWAAMIITILTLLLSIYGAYKLYFYYDVEPKVKTTKGKPIGGWLILIGLGLVLTPITSLVTLLQETAFFDAYTWSVLWQTEGMQGKPFVFLIAMELVYNIARIIFSIILIILFFEKRSSIPNLMIILYLATFVFIVLDTIAAYTISGDSFTSEEDYESTKDIVKMIIQCAIWVPYFLISDRVKHTFVKRGKHYIAAPVNDVEDSSKEDSDKPYNSSQPREL